MNNTSFPKGISDIIDFVTGRLLHKRYASGTALCLMCAGSVLSSQDSTGLLGIISEVAARDVISALSDDVLPRTLEDGSQRAFPTAEGFGAAARGGRGGRVIYVTSLDSEGEGSLRACAEAEGPRVCIFRTSGTVELTNSSIAIRHPFLTIAGETAPGGGIAIKNSPNQKRPSLEITTNDIIIRHIRLRPGPHEVEACCAGALGMYTPAATRIMLDHISASWGSDETVDSEDATDFTWQWGIASEPLLDGGPGKKDRARNMLFTKGGDVTVHHSLFAMGKFRNPLIKMEIPEAVADVVNNVLYSPEWQFVISFGDEWSRIQANVTGNYKLAGENKENDKLVSLFEESGLGHSIYLEGNYDQDYRPNDQMPEDAVLAEGQQEYASAMRFTAPDVRTTTAQTAFEEVLANAGAIKPKRDEVDQRVVEAVRNGNGRILKHNPEKVGGWPQLEAEEPYPDSDVDGMDDRWEIAQRFDPNNDNDGALDRDGDGWTNLEEFLHMLAGDPSGTGP